LGDYWLFTVQCLVRSSSDTTQIALLCKQALYRNLVVVDRVDLCDATALLRRIDVSNVTYIYHCAAKGGDWGPEEDFVVSNLRATESLIAVAEQVRVFES
jgi:nucleoside-diphosphate-sugar epimerase